MDKHTSPGHEVASWSTFALSSVTAGTAGLGAAICRNLAQSGFRLAINYANNGDRAENLIQELTTTISSNTSASGVPRYQPFRADVGDRPSVQKLVQDTVTTFGRIDLVVSNAGWTKITNFLNLEEGMVDEDWDKCFVYNVKSHLWSLHAAKAELEKSEGAFITTTSIAGVKPAGSSLPYSVTKAAAIHLTKALAAICSPKVRVNCVSPGLLLTEWGMKFPEEKREGVREATPLKRLPTVEDCAEQVKTPALNRSMTGQNIILDGGLTL
ncbi:hypothetical protein CKM354_000932100 [Cercospora kikuchii]|uniref:Granaticin polyketide synthase ketoacyl reductase 2 n=1 Tax=Cercospora kikuchii TaxID=84275 RepID=A0A9P3CXC7_9PEZI|nr:uncharacterized protein CKM354_000932100 [Cercospora kikuchii]GIZ46183.1 hypothetical protein CKM354_000932100 [Cercospora kikuchii]